MRIASNWNCLSRFVTKIIDEKRIFRSEEDGEWRLLNWQLELQ